MSKFYEDAICRKCGKTFSLVTEKLPCKMEEERVRDTYVICPYCKEAYYCREASDEMVSAEKKH